MIPLLQQVFQNLRNDREFTSIQKKQKQNEISEEFIQKMEKYWDSYTKTYEKVNSNYNQVYCMFANLLNIYDADSIIEVGCGTGQNIPHILQRKKKETYYLVSDLSSQMLSMTQARIKNYLADPIFYYHNNIDHLIQSFDENLKFPEINLECKKLNAENLDTIKDNSFDCYFANFCLMLVANAQFMLNESFRILKKNGRAIFTVWGRKHLSQWQSTLPKVGEEIGINLSACASQNRSNFYLNNREVLIKMMEKAGFSKIMCWNNFVPLNLIDKEDFKIKFEAPEVLNLFKTIQDPKIIDMIKEKFKEKCNEEICDKHLAFGMDQLTIFGIKE